MFMTLGWLVVLGMLLACVVGHLAQLRADRLWDERETEAARRSPGRRFPWHR